MYAPKDACHRRGSTRLCAVCRRPRGRRHNVVLPAPLPGSPQHAQVDFRHLQLRPGLGQRRAADNHQRHGSQRVKERHRPPRRGLQPHQEGSGAPPAHHSHRTHGRSPQGIRQPAVVRRQHLWVASFVCHHDHCDCRTAGAYPVVLSGTEACLGHDYCCYEHDAE